MKGVGVEEIGVTHTHTNTYARTHTHTQTHLKKLIVATFATDVEGVEAHRLEFLELLHRFCADIAWQAIG